MSNDTFDRFLAQLPDLLQRFPDATGDLVARFLGDVQTDSGRHTVTLAVTGKMKQGKSSLINALIDRDLPTTGVTEALSLIHI